MGKTNFKGNSNKTNDPKSRSIFQNRKPMRTRIPIEPNRAKTKKNGGPIQIISPRSKRLKIAIPIIKPHHINLSNPTHWIQPPGLKNNPIRLIPIKNLIISHLTNLNLNQSLTITSTQRNSITSTYCFGNYWYVH